MLIITRTSRSQLPPDEAENAGKHRFECRTCPYQMLLDRAYFERRHFEPSHTDDVLGGASVWDNVDRTEGLSLTDAVDGCVGCAF
jgi:DNA-directed RNA polymerase III subunit RPC11